MNIIFRVDASKKLGNGHLYRSFNLAEVLKNKKNKVFFITNQINKLLEKKLKSKNFKILKIKNVNTEKKDAQLTLKKIKLNKIEKNIIILDSYSLGIKWQRMLYKNTKIMMVIDDLNRNNYADIILNQNLNYQIKKNKNLKKQKFLMGPKYSLINKRYSNESLPRTKKLIKNVLIFMGGSDRKNLTHKILSIFSGFKYNQFNFKIIIGQNNANYKRIKKKYSNHQNFKICYNLDNLISAIKDTDIAVSSIGSVIWELIYFKKPVIGLIQSKNQIPNSLILNKQRKIKLLKNASKKNIDHFISKNLNLKNFNTKYKKRVIDGKGVFRVKNEILRKYDQI